MRKLIVLYVFVVLVASLLAPAPSVAHEDSCLGPVFSLSDWAEPPWADEVMYVGVEGGTAPFVIQRGGHDCTSTQSLVYYSVTAATAESSDFSVDPGPAEIVGDGTDALVHQPVTVTLAPDDSDANDGVERAVVSLTEQPTYGKLGLPTSANLYILDDDDASENIGFIPQRFSRNEFFDSVEIPVFRWGDVSLATTVNYIVEGGPDEPATPGGDIAESGSAQFRAGSYWTWISIPLFDDAVAEPTEKATVTLLGDSVTGAATAEVSIEDNEENIPPTSRFHHPKNGYSYPYKDYRIREPHVFTDDVGSGVRSVEWALRKRMLSGACRWWNGDGWTDASCSQRKWLKMRKYSEDFFYARLRPLGPSVGTRVKNYTAFSRAVDRSGNREQVSTSGRNANTFEVKRR